MPITAYVFAAFLVGTLASGAQRTFAQAQDICPTLTQLMGAAESDFPNLRGSQWRSRAGRPIAAYDANVAVLNGRCSIHEPDPDDREEVTSYSCDWRHNDAQAALAFAEQLSNAVRACVRRSPVARQRSTGTRTQHLGHYYTMPARQRDHITVSVTANSRGRPNDTVHETTLNISAEKEVR